MKKSLKEKISSFKKKWEFVSDTFHSSAELFWKIDLESVAVGTKIIYLNISIKIIISIS